MRILIIGANAKTREILQVTLEQNAFTIDVERDFRKGLSTACVNAYHLAIVEHTFPALDAHAFCHDLRGRGRSFPVLVLIPGHDRSLGTRCLDRGADDFMTVPFSMPEFISRVMALMRRPLHIQAEEIQAGSVLIDRRRQIVRKNGKRIELTRSEYAVIEALAMRKDGFVSKSELIESVWGEADSAFFERALDTHIYRLRRKLERGGKRVIKTVFGRGYRLE